MRLQFRSFSARLYRTRKRLLIPLLVTIPAFGQQASKYVGMGAVPAGWRIALYDYGDRLQRPGKERLVLKGSVTRKNSAAVPFQLIHELPGMIQYQEQGGPGAATLAFDGSQYGKDAGGVQKQDTDLVETLAYDTPATFFYAPSNGVRVRKLGSRFRMDGQTSKLYSGSSYDVYLVLESVAQPGKVKLQPKYYHVNSDTHMVERVHYQDVDNPAIKVEIILDSWTTVSKNRVPQSIRRLENGVEVLRFAINSATLGPSLADGAFKTH